MIHAFVFGLRLGAAAVGVVVGFGGALVLAAAATAIICRLKK